MTDIKDGFEVKKTPLELKKAIDPQTGYFYTNTESMPTHYADAVEMHNEESGLNISFYHRRPIRRKPIDVQETQNGLSITMNNPDSMAFMLQSSVVISDTAAHQLFLLLGRYLESNSNQENQYD